MREEQNVMQLKDCYSPRKEEEEEEEGEERAGGVSQAMDAEH